MLDHSKDALKIFLSYAQAREIHQDTAKLAHILFPYQIKLLDMKIHVSHFFEKSL